MEIKARAKINLFLDVLGLRPDGYHEILTVMQSLELHDILEIEASLEGDLQVECSDPGIPSGSGNLAYKAADLLRREFGGAGARIFINKNIPHSAGLAGGSSNAAAALKCLNAAWDINISPEELFSLGEKIGSDVPFCLLGNTAVAGGRGEALTPLPPFSGVGVVLVKPSFGVSTAQAYRLYDALPPMPEQDAGALVRAMEGKDFTAVAGLMYNALERVTVSLYPEIMNIKSALVGAGAAGSLMTGSGPTVFGLCPSPGEALAVASRLNLPGCRIIATATI
ncbi:MAG: hypothetical protein VR68_07340 [Peptococcaceae bacterium BRH_c4a]|nr:MAG: hypothetical protein VR68_07340 [Peptococcaceae bacterium BRH_c4a]